MPTVIDFPETVTRKRHIHEMLDTAGTVDLPDIDWVARTVTFDDDYPQPSIDYAQERFDAYDPTPRELDLLDDFLGDSPISGMTPVEAFQWTSDYIDGISSLAQAKAFLGQAIPLLVGFLVFETNHLREDDRL
jgi:hypothetical protein